MGKLETLQLAFIFALFIILGGTFFISIIIPNKSELDNEQHYKMVANWSQKYENVNSDFSKVRNITSDESASDDKLISTFGKLNALITSVWSMLTQIYGSFSYMFTIVTEMGDLIPGIPSWMPTLAILSIIIIVGYAIMSAVLQWKL